MPEETKEMAEKGSCTDIVPRKLTLDQERFLAARLSYSGDGDAASSCGLNPKTPAEWKRINPEFKRRYDRLGIDARTEAVRYLRALWDQAMERLAERLDSSNERTQLKAIEIALAYGGLARSADVNVTVMDRTKQLLEELRGVEDAERSDSEPDVP